MSDPAVVTVQTLRDWPLPELGDGKDARGRVLVVGGSASTPGAARLAAEGVLRAGSGKVRIATADVAATALGMALPESAVIALPTLPGGHLDPASAPRLREEAEEVDAVLVGPGLTGVGEVS